MEVILQFPLNFHLSFKKYFLSCSLKNELTKSGVVLTILVSILSRFDRFHMPPHTTRFFVGRQKIFTCRLMRGELTKSGFVGRYLTVLDLKTSCRALSASVRWTKTICRGSRVPQPMRNCHESHMNKPLFKHGGDRLDPKTKRG